MTLHFGSGKYSFHLCHLPNHTDFCYHEGTTISLPWLSATNCASKDVAD